MVSFSNDSPGSKGFVYFPHEDLKESQNRREEAQQEQNISNELLDKLLRTIGREVLREKIPNLQELEQTLKNILTVHDRDRKSTRLNSSHVSISYAVFCLKKKKKKKKK